MFDGNHRRAILNKASFGITSDLDNVLGDLDSAIKDLEAFSVVCTHQLVSESHMLCVVPVHKAVYVCALRWVCDW